MLSISRTRKILGKEAQNLSDEQIENALASLYSLAEAFYSLSEYDTNKPNGRKQK